MILKIYANRLRFLSKPKDMMGGRVLLILTILVIRDSLAQVPASFTQAAGPIGSTNATLNGMAVPNGMPTEAWFEWGTDSSYGQLTAPTNIGSGMKVARVIAPINALLGGSVYSYRLVASNAFGVKYGAQAKFSTGAKIQNWGQFGNVGGLANVPPGLTNLVGIAAGHEHCLGLTSQGTALIWGGTFFSNFTPVPAGLSNVVALAGGYSHSLALKQDGTVVVWGNYFPSGSPATLPAGLSNVIAIAAGDSHSLFLKSDGSVVRQGGDAPPSTLTNIVAIAAGSSHSIGLRADGKVIGWGFDSGGNPAPPPSLSNVVAVSTETWHNLALREDGTVVAWGHNQFGKTNVPPGLSNVVAVAAGFNHSLALKADGSLVGWGESLYVTNVPTGLTNCVAIASGDEHSIALSPENLRPQISNSTMVGETNRDIIISLPKWDANGDPLNFRITAPATNGQLYQYTGSGRGAPINLPETVVTNGSQVVFAPDPEEFGAPYSLFTYVANDGLSDSASGNITLNILPRPRMETSGYSLNPNPGFVLSFAGLSNASYSVYGSINAVSWTRLGSATQASPGLFFFRDNTVTNAANRIYRIRSP
jgi:alpha-tubulin suppressor-like RCC1 family protein